MTRRGWRLVVSLLAGILILAAECGADEAPRVLLVDDFEDIQNALGGYRNPFQRAPSRVDAARTTGDDHGRTNIGKVDVNTGSSVRIRAHRADQGFCGYWLHFFDFKAAETSYLDTRPYNFLSFWVKGEQGGETFLIKLADRKWIEKEDALPIGQVTEFLTGGVTQQWREVLIPLDRLPTLDRREMGGLTIEFETPGEQVVYLDNVAFKTAARTSLPSVANTPTIVSHQATPRKLWAWKSSAVLLDQQAGDTLLDFCTRQGIDEIWMQLLYSLVPPADDNLVAATTIKIHYAAELRDFLRRSHARGIRIHALDGAAHYSQRAHHRIPLAVVEGVIAFNHRGAKAEQFDGVHFDNEPYLLLGWVDPALREEILLEFLELNAECQRRIRADAQMKFGIDIPFWWQERDTRTGRPIGEVEFQGKRQAASYHCIELLDNVGVMNYRDSADGADGMIAHGRGLLAFADRAAGAKILMGVETFRSAPTPVYFALGLPRPLFFDALRDSAASLARTYTLLDFRLRTLDDGEYVHVGIEVPPESSPARRREALRALAQLARQTGSGLQADHDVSAATRRAAEFTAADAEWTDLATIQIEDAENNVTYPGFRVTHTMLSKITFADDPSSQFAAEIAAAETYFARYKSFGGMAVHYYETMRELLEE